MNRPRGRRIATVAALGIGVMTAAGFASRQWINEKWQIYRLQSGDEKAKKAAIQWMSWYGGEESFLALLRLTYDSMVLLICDMRKEVVNFDHAALNHLLTIRPKDRPMFFGEKLAASTKEAMGMMRERMGPERIAAIAMKVLEKRVQVTPGLAIWMARGIVINDQGNRPAGILDLAVRRLQEGLSDSDPIVRAGAAYGLADAGSQAGQGAIKAIKPLLDDPDPLVHEAALHAINRLSLPGTAEELPR
jgi:HEAT repeat protein